MPNNSFLETAQAKSANINIRVSPWRKARLIEQGADRGLHLSDYIHLILDKGEQAMIDNDDNQQAIQTLTQQLDELQQILQPLFEKTKGKTLFLGKESIIVHSRADLLTLLVRCVKIKGI